MIEALLFSVRDALRSAGFGYSEATCEISDEGKPSPRMGDVFVAVHQGAESNDALNNLDEYFSWNCTLTMRVTVPLDRVGNALLARQLARRAAPGGQPSFNARKELLRAFLHMNWGILQDANTNLVNMLVDANAVYGFCEPAHFSGAEIPMLVGGEWFTGDPEARDTGLKSTLRFEGCRRLQPIGTYQ